MSHPSPPRSRITGGDTQFLFQAKVLGKHLVNYYRCADTGFIQTDDPHWLGEAYTSAIASLDTGYVKRNFTTAKLTTRIIDSCFPNDKSFIDFGGGYGLFTRLMRDKGFPFLRQDIYCKNLFAIGFDREDSPDTTFDFLTSFEVFEHLPDPRSGLAEMLKLSRTILFSTQLVPDRKISSADDWWYFIPETGQHVSFYTESALRHLASLNDLELFTNGSTMHLMTDRQPLEDPFRGQGLLSRLARAISKKRKPPGRRSLKDSDFHKLLQAQRDRSEDSI